MCSDSVYVATPRTAGGHGSVEVALPWGQTAQMRLHNSGLPEGPEGSLGFTAGPVCAGSVPTVLGMALPILVEVFPGGAVLSPKWAQHWGHLVSRTSSGDRLKWFSLSLRGMPAQSPPNPPHYKGRGSGRCGQ